MIEKYLPQTRVKDFEENVVKAQKTVVCARENLTEKPIYLLTTKINKLKNPFLRLKRDF